MTEATRFKSIDELTREHSALLQLYLTGKIDAAIPGAKEFVARATRTGAILEKRDDREAAQSRIDYWSTTLLRGFGISFAEALLQDFKEEDLASVRSEIAEQARGTYAGLDAAGQSLMRRLIARVAELPESGEIVARRIAVAELRKLGDILGPLGKLEKAGVVRIAGRSNAEQTWVEAADPGVLEAWPEARAWLKEERNQAKQRQSVRIAAQQWDAHARDAGGLLAGSLLKQAEAFDDLDDLENQFVRASLGVETWRLRKWIGVLVFIVALLASSIAAIAHAWSLTDQQKSRAEQLLRFRRQMTATNEPHAQTSIPCVCLVGDPATPNGERYLSLTIDGFEATDAASVIFRLEFPNGKHPLVLTTTAPKNRDPPDPATWIGSLRPERIFALIEYSDPFKLPLLGDCGDVKCKLPPL